jgi:Tfp pilus assembly protein PilP
MMNRDRHSIIGIVGLMFLFPLFWACGEEPAPPKQPKVVKQKIVSTQAVPKPAPAPAPKAATAKPAAAAKPAPMPKTDLSKPVKRPAGQASVEIDAGKQQVDDWSPEEGTLIYVRAGKVDPFAPLFRDEPKKDKKKPEFVPKTPLQKMDLDQFKLVAILRSRKMGPRGLVEDSTGKGFVVQPGTYIGNKGGQVIRIEEDRLIVKEPGEDMYGKEIEVERPLTMKKGDI